MRQQRQSGPRPTNEPAVKRGEPSRRRWVARLGGLGSLLLAGCAGASSSSAVQGKGGYFAFGNVEIYRAEPARLTVETAITDVQYAILVPFVAAIVAALASAYAFVHYRRQHRPADWGLPIGSAVIAALLGVVGWGSTTIEAVVDQQAKTLRIEQHHLWGIVPQTTSASLAEVRNVQLAYRSGRGAHCASTVHWSRDEPTPQPLFRFVDILSDEIDVATCERLQQRVAEALGTVASPSVEEPSWW